MAWRDAFLWLDSIIPGKSLTHFRKRAIGQLGTLMYWIETTLALAFLWRNR
jgi:hypothetical protein